MLVCLAHGSRDPRHGGTVEALAAAVRARRPGLDVRTAYLDHNLPGVHDVVAALGGDAAVAVPLLLGNAFHGRVDVPAAWRDALARHPGERLNLGAVLGPDPALLAALERRLAEAGTSDPAAARPDGVVLASAGTSDPAAARPDGVVLASAGTSDPAARAALVRLARRWRPAGGPAVALGFAAGPGPRVGAAVEALRAGGATRIAVASWFLAPGLLYDRARADALAAGADAVAGVLGPALEVTDLVLRRYDAAARRGTRRSTRRAA